jgi:hypothetical protein
LDAAKHGRCAAGMKIFFKPQIPDWRMIPLDVESTTTTIAQAK